MRVFRNSEGVTLAEVLMVLAIGAVFVTMGVRLTYSLKSDANVLTVQANVDSLFQSAAYFYYANCRRQLNPVTGPIPGTGLLDPTPDATNTNPATPYPLSITNLQTQGYLQNKIITTGLASNYVVQLNEITPLPDRMVQTANGPLPAGKIVMWRIQISVLLSPSNQTAAKERQYLSMLGGDCLSNLDAGGSTVTPCTKASTTGKYVVWERLPSYPVPKAPSNYYRTNARDALQTQEYTNYPQSYLLSAPAGIQQYYLCGT